MSLLTLSAWTFQASSLPSRDAPPKTDWPLMCDLSSVRAGVPETLIRWRRAEGETPPPPSDPDLR